jgi:Ca2+-binding RTX toxin-like protein
MNAGAGSDSVSGQIQGSDTIYGGSGEDDLDDDSYRCGAECVDDLNRLYGGGGNDYLYGQTKLYGGP